MKILSNLDLRQNQILNAVVQHLETAPVAPVKGQIYFNTVDDKFYGFTENNQWVELSSIYDDSAVKETLEKIKEQIENLGLDLESEKDRAEKAEEALQQAIDTKADQTDLTALEERVTATEGDIASLEGRMDAAESELEAQQGRLDVVEGDIVTINEEIEGVKSDVSDNAAAIEAVTERVTTVEGKVTALEEASNEFDSKIDELEAELNDEIARATAEEQRIEGLVTAEANRAQAEETKIREEFAAADAALNATLTEKIKEVSDKLDADKAELQDNIDTLTEVVEQNSTDIAKVASDLAQEVKDRQAADAAQDLVIETKADKSYVDAELAKKAEKVHTHVMADIVDLGTVAALNVGNGAGQVPVLDENGKLAFSTIPSLAVNTTVVVNSIEEAMALNQKSGDIVVINPQSAQRQAIIDKFKADQLNFAKGFEVLDANVLNDEFAGYLAQGKTTFICVEPEADTFEERYRPLNSLADTMNRAEIESALAEKADKVEVDTAIQGVKDYAEAKVESAKTELTGAINSAKSELEQAISNLDSKVDGVDTKVDANAQEIEAIKEAATQLESKVDTHINDTVKHITAEERLSWNSRTKKVVATIGDGVAKQFEVVHNLASEDVQVTVKEAATGMVVFTDINCSDANKVVISFGKAPLTSEFKVVVIG